VIDQPLESGTEYEAVLRRMNEEIHRLISRNGELEQQLTTSQVAFNQLKRMTDEISS
jgi:hypothetical protein